MFTGAQPGQPMAVLDARGRLVATALANASGPAALVLPAERCVRGARRPAGPPPHG